MKKKVFTIVTVVLIILIIALGVSFAYFMVSTSNESITSVFNFSSERNIFTYEITPQSITITPNEFNLAQNGEDLEAVSNVVVTYDPRIYLNAPGSGFSSSYNLYLLVQSNTLDYTTQNNTPELTLKVSKLVNDSYSNFEIASNNGLTKVSNYVYDITEFTGLIAILEGEILYSTYENPILTETYKIELTFHNLETSQNANIGKSFQAKIIGQKEPYSS